MDRDTEVGRVRLGRLVATAAVAVAFLSTGTAASHPLTDATPPSAPSSLKVTWGPASLVLSWKAATDDVGVTGYQIYRGGSAVKVVPSPELSYTDDEGHARIELECSNVRNHAVAAIDAAGNMSARPTFSGCPTVKMFRWHLNRGWTLKRAIATISVSHTKNIFNKHCWVHGGTQASGWHYISCTETSRDVSSGRLFNHKTTTAPLSKTGMLVFSEILDGQPGCGFCDSYVQKLTRGYKGTIQPFVIR